MSSAAGEVRARGGVGRAEMREKEESWVWAGFELSEDMLTVVGDADARRAAGVGVVYVGSRLLGLKSNRTDLLFDGDLPMELAS